MSVRPASRMLRAISLGVFCRLAPSTRAIMRSRNVSPGLAVIRTTMRSESTRVPPVTARAVAAGLADDRGRLAGDGRLVDAGDALDDLAVAGDDLAGLDDDEVAVAAARRPGTSSVAAVGATARRAIVSVRVCAQRVGLGLAAALGHRLGEVGEEDGEPEPDGDQQTANDARRVPDRGERRWSARAPTSTTNITGFAISARVELAEASGSAAARLPGSSARSAVDGTVGRGVRRSRTSDESRAGPRRQSASDDGARGRGRGRR